MGGVGVAAPGGDHAVFHNGAAALSDVTRRGGVAYTYSPWMRDYESGYSLHNLVCITSLHGYFFGMYARSTLPCSIHLRIAEITET